MSDYEIKHTDSSKPPITVGENSIDRDSVGVSLVGRIFQNYGEDINTSLLNLLENFSCPEDSSSTSATDATPDLNVTSQAQLTNPVEGQFWYNSTRSLLYFFDGLAWIPVDNRGSYAANWGMVTHGEQLPKPVIIRFPVKSNLVSDGGTCPDEFQTPDCSKVYDYANPIIEYEFEYDECIWSVSPAAFSGPVDGLNCSTDDNAVVTAQLRYANTAEFVNSVANYLIIGIKGNTDLGGMRPPPVVMSPTPTPTVSITPSVTPSDTPMYSPTPTPTPTRTPAVTPTTTGTPVVTPTRTRTRQPSGTPPVTPTRTVTATRTRTPAGTPGVTPTRTRTRTPGVTPTRTRTRTPAASSIPHPCANMGCPEPGNDTLPQCGCPLGSTPRWGGGCDWGDGHWTLCP